MPDSLHTPDSWPKVLVATAFPPCSPGGSGWLLQQLMRGCPADRFSWWSCGGVPPAEASGYVSAYESGGLPARLMPNKRYTAVKSLLLENYWVPRAARSLRNFIRRQKPDLLWVLPYMWAAPVIHRAITGLGIPWHITVHDFADTLGGTSTLGPRRAVRFQRMIEELYAGAASRDVYMQEISDEMERVTGRKADAIIRCGVEPEELATVRAKTFTPPRDKIRIGYPGTIITEDTFERFIAAIRIIRPKLPLPVEVNLFGSHSYSDRPWFDPSFIVEHGYLPAEELDRRYNNCDWGLAIMNLDDSNPRYTRFTFPCKFTRALAAGIPLICIGHPESTLSRLARRYNLGVVISDPGPEQIASALLPALSNPGAMPQARNDILRCAETEFNAESNRRALHGLLVADYKKQKHPLDHA